MNRRCTERLGPAYQFRDGPRCEANAEHPGPHVAALKAVVWGTDTGVTFVLEDDDHDPEPKPVNFEVFQRPSINPRRPFAPVRHVTCPVCNERVPVGGNGSRHDFGDAKRKHRLESPECAEKMMLIKVTW